MKFQHWLYTVPLRLRSLFRRAEVDRELDDEFQFHLERYIEQELARGRSPEEARREAMRALGGLPQRKEECRDMRKVNLIENLRKDLFFAIRQLRRSPGFAATAVLVLGAGICASVAIFAFVDAALIKPLPFRDPAGLVAVFERVALFPQSNLSYPDYLDWKRANTVFRSLDIYQRNGAMLCTPAGVQPARTTRVSDGFFRTLGVGPVLGRDFYEGEDLPSAPRAAMLSYATWQTRYGGARDVIGQSVMLDGEANVIVGVLPRGFHFAPAGPAEFWTAFHASRSCQDLRGAAATASTGRRRTLEGRCVSAGGSG